MAWPWGFLYTLSTGCTHPLVTPSDTPRDTLPASVTQYTGRPGPDATHWGIWKVGAGGREERLNLKGPDGVYGDVWPLEELSLEEVRNRWQGGEFRCFWLVEDPENPQPEMRRRAAGRGRTFRIAQDGAPPPFQLPTAHFQTPPAAATGGTIGELERIAALMGMMKQFSGQPAIVPDERNVDLAAKVAELMARLEHSDKLREIEDRHRRQVDDYRDQVRDLRSKIRRLEEAEERGPGISLKDGEGVWDVVKKHFAANPGTAIKQLTDLFRSTPMVLQAVTQAANAAQANPAPTPSTAVVARPRAVPGHLRAVPPDQAPPSIAPLDLSIMAKEAGSKREPNPVPSPAPAK